MSALPERLPGGAAAAAAAAADSRQGELQSIRRQQPAAAVLQEHRAAVATAATETAQAQHQAQGQDPQRGADQGQGPQRGRTPGRAPGGAAGEDAGGSGRGGDGTQIGFVELDPEPLLPPLWGQSPEQHDKEVRAFKQGLAQDRAVGKQRLAAFAGDRQAKSAELAGLALQLTRQVNGAKTSALARIGSAETSGVAAVQAAVRSAQAGVAAQAQAARAQVEAGHAAAVAAMEAAANGARAGMDNGFRTSDQLVTTKQTGQLTALGGLYTRTEQRMRDAANHAGDLAVGAGNRRAQQFRAGMIHRDDSFLEGPLTDNRCKAQADAATGVGDAYKAELPKAVDEPVNDMKNGRPDAEKSIRAIADDVRKSLNTVLTQSKTSLADAHQQSRKGADDAKRAALQGISQALSAAQASLTQHQTTQTAAIRTQAAQQRQAAERNAAGAVVAIGKGVTTARGGLDRGLTQFLRVLGQDEVPDPEQLDDVLRQTGDQLDQQLENSAQGLRGQADQVATSLTTMAERGAQGMSATAEAASATAAQTASATGQTLSRTASQTVNGLRQVQQGYAEVARNTQTGHANANRQVIEGLDKAYTDLAGQFQKGSDGQVKAVADGLNKAATQDIHPKIDEEAQKAYDQVKPRWQSVLTILIVIIVVVALAIALGPLVIGAVTAGAAALGAGAAAATIGVIVGGAVVGAVAGAVGQVVSNALNGQPLLDGVLKAAAFGAIGGAIGGGAAATVAKTALGTGTRMAVEMVIEVVAEVGLGAADAAISGQAYGWGDVLLGAVTTVAVTGVMANPRVQAITTRVQVGVTGGLNRLGIKVPSLSGSVDAPDAPATPKVPDSSGAAKVDVPTPGKVDVSTPATPDVSGPAPGGDRPGGGGTPQPGRGPDGATSWDVSDVDPTGGAGRGDGPVRPQDQDGIETELRTALGPLASQVDVRIDPSLSGRSVRVHYDVGEDGLISNVRMLAGPSVTPADIRLHVPTARTMMRYGGLSGRVRQLLRQVGEWVGVHGAPPVGSKAWEARLELRKLPDIIADRTRAYADADPATRAELEAELDSLTAQVETHANTLKEWNLDPGRGYVAADSTGPLDKSTGGRQPDETADAMRRAAAARTPTGEIDPAGLRKLMDSLPEVPVETNAMTQFAAQSIHSSERVTLEPVGGEGARGVSGAPVYLIRGSNGDVVGVLKIFPKAEEFARELSALQRLGGLPEGSGHSVSPLGVARTAGQGEGGMLVSSAAQGQAIDQLMLKAARARSPERAAKFGELRDAVAANASALAQLHTTEGSGGKVSPAYMKRHIDAVNDIVTKLESKRGVLAKVGIDVTELRHRATELITQFRANPGGSAIVHGDAHPGNFFYDPTTGVTMIDTPTLHFSLDAQGAPIGAPARDVANFGQKLANFGQTFGLTPNEVTDLQQVFRQSYADGGGATLTGEAEAFFRARTALGELIRAADGAAGDLGSGRPDRLEALRSQAALAKDALGLRSVPSAE